MTIGFSGAIVSNLFINDKEKIFSLRNPAYRAVAVFHGQQKNSATQSGMNL
jgi:hypothetical protein